MRIHLFIFLGLSLFFAGNSFANDDVVIDLSVLDAMHNTPQASTLPQIDYEEHPLLIKENTPDENKSASSIINLPQLEPQFPIIKNKPTTKKLIKKPVAKPSLKAKKVEKEAMKEKLSTYEPKEIKKVMYDYEMNVGDVIDINGNEVRIWDRNEIEKTQTPPIKVDEEQINSNEQDLDEKTIIYKFDENEEIISFEENYIEGNDIEDYNDEEEIIESPEELKVKKEIIENKENNSVSFGENSSELSHNNKATIDSIISRFEDASKNKINIISYNFKGEGSSFKNYRLSLSRATEVRSYLISKGFKDFAVRVEPVLEDSDKLNNVDIIEIK